MKVILENTETGELREMHNNGSFVRPWRIKEVVPESTPDNINAKLAVIGTKLGLPIPQFLDAARWLLKKDCPYCELGTEILRRIAKLGDKQTTEFIKRILAAKSANDIDALNQIRREVNG
jgi:hypothetical protein